jgi:hypothetical protein
MAFDPVTIGLTEGIKAIATNLAKVSIEGGWQQFLKLNQHSKDNLLLRFSDSAHKYAENYIDRHGMVKALGMTKPVPLDKLFTKVLVFNEDAAVDRLSLEQQEQSFKEKNPDVGNDKKRPGLEIANECQYLMVLGGPGIGKTTFLRKVGLEALRGEQGNYRHGLIPVLLELRAFREGTIDLKQAIVQEFANCGLSDYEKFTDRFLGDGKLLILLDGLDEVPTDRTSEMVQKIQDFVGQYSKNHFIASCRIAAYRHNFQRFTDITIVNFDDNQIDKFIDNWFRSQGRSEWWGTRCWEQLNSTEHCATKELAHTPLLLTLICIVYNRTGNFPTSRATLYERALQVLLEEWDAAKEIIQEVLYKGLDTKRKTLMLEKVAYTSFIANKLFIQRHEIVNIIETTLRGMLPDEKAIDGKKVIKDIEKQHGLLIARDEGIYSFSHLTIQEYLTAEYILKKDEISLDSVVNNYMLDRNWREVFILIAGIKPADRLLQAMENRVHDYMETEKLQNLLVWVANVANPLGGNIQPLGKRALAITNANAIANAYTYAKSVAQSILTNKPRYIFDSQSVENDIARNNSESMDNSKIFSNYITNTNSMAIDVAIAYADSEVISDTYSIVYAKSIAVTFFRSINSAINNLIEYAQTVEGEKVYQSIDLSEIIEEMNALRQDIPDDGQPIIFYQQFAKKLFQSWFQAFRLKPEMLDFNLSDLQAMENYLYAIKLIIDCRKAAVQVENLSTWDQIESRLLMPKSLHQY